MPERNGKRKAREQSSKQRKPELGYYLIITDTKKTEQNFFIGLRDSIPKELQRKLTIKVRKTDTANLVNEAIKEQSLHPQYGETWIVFDRDQVPAFDKIIRDAEQNSIKVGWSNPCIEIWFHAYFGGMPVYYGSVDCCRGFSEKYTQVTGQDYEKFDSEIYSKLCQYGDERRAIKIAEKRFTERMTDKINVPSEMYSCTTLHTLIAEISEKINP